MHFTEKQVKNWCDRYGYSDFQLVDNRWWAIPPHGVIPICIHAELAELLYWQWWAISPGGILPNRCVLTERAKRKFWEKLDQLGCRILDIFGI